MSEGNSILYSHEVLEFVKSSHDFCRWIDDQEVIDRKAFVQEGLSILSRLYSWMIVVPDISPVFNETTEKVVTEADWSLVYRKISTILGAMNDYSDIPEAMDFDRSELITRTISEDISDIYQDIRDFLEVYRDSPEEIMNDALWECKTNFENTWGEKLLRVARALHNAIMTDEFESGQAWQKQSNRDSLKKIDTSNWFISKRQQEFGEQDENISE